VAQPKAMFGACMASFYVATGSITSRDIVTCGWSSVFGGAGLEGLISRLTGKQSFAVWLGTRVLTALGATKYASPLAGGLVGFAIIAG